MPRSAARGSGGRCCVASRLSRAGGVLVTSKGTNGSAATPLVKDASEGNPVINPPRGRRAANLHRAAARHKGSILRRRTPSGRGSRGLHVRPRSSAPAAQGDAYSQGRRGRRAAKRPIRPAAPFWERTSRRDGDSPGDRPCRDGEPNAGGHRSRSPRGRDLSSRNSCKCLQVFLVKPDSSAARRWGAGTAGLGLLPAKGCAPESRRG